MSAGRNSIIGKTVLITGAGGSIGSALTHYVAAHTPKKLWLLNHNELALHSMNMAIHTFQPEVDTGLILADIQDRISMISWGDIARPDIVIHTAAIKHVNFAEENPLRAVAINIIGTQNVLQACWMAEKFIFISTDKAVCPTSVMGSTKRAAEILVHRYGGLVIRLCNVHGSSGSVIPLFQKQLEDGVPLTVTDKNVERSFIRTEDVVWLVKTVIEERDWHGKVYSIPPAWTNRIYDLAKEMAGPSKATIKIIGLRKGEKIKEVLFAPWEHPEDVDGMLVAMSEQPDLEHRKIDYHLNELFVSVKEVDTSAALSVLVQLVPESDLSVGSDSVVV